MCRACSSCSSLICPRSMRSCSTDFRDRVPAAVALGIAGSPPAPPAPPAALAGGGAQSCSSSRGPSSGIMCVCVAGCAAASGAEVVVRLPNICPLSHCQTRIHGSSIPPTCAPLPLKRQLEAVGAVPHDDELRRDFLESKFVDYLALAIDGPADHAGLAAVTAHDRLELSLQRFGALLDGQPFFFLLFLQRGLGLGRVIFLCFGGVLAERVGLQLAQRHLRQGRVRDELLH